jgi:hypothetical protein
VKQQKIVSRNVQNPTSAEKIQVQNYNESNLKTDFSIQHHNQVIKHFLQFANMQP